MGRSRDVEPQLLDAVKYCIEHKSRLLVPSFAVGRTQTMLWYMEKFIHEGKIPRSPIFVDSPMGVEMSKITSQFRDNYDEETQRPDRQAGPLRPGAGHVCLDAGGEQADQPQAGADGDHRIEPDVRVRPDPASSGAERRTAERHGGVRRLDAAEHARAEAAGRAASACGFTTAGTT